MSFNNCYIDDIVYPPNDYLSFSEQMNDRNLGHKKTINLDF
jgi:hypothetical protein